MVYIVGLLWDEENEEHIARHSIDVEEVEQAVEQYQYAQNSRGYLMVLGQTYAGRYLTIILDHEGDGYWYTVTARNMTQSERGLLRRKASSRRKRR